LPRNEKHIQIDDTTIAHMYGVYLNQDAYGYANTGDGETEILSPHTHTLQLTTAPPNIEDGVSATYIKPQIARRKQHQLATLRDVCRNKRRVHQVLRTNMYNRMTLMIVWMVLFTERVRASSILLECSK
jgi:hypothetical protein